MPENLYITIFKDPEGLPRGWGQAGTQKKSITMARWQCKDYCTYPNSGALRGLQFPKDFTFETSLQKES